MLSANTLELSENACSPRRMCPDITQLMLTYAIPSYKLPEWIDKSIHKKIFGSENIISNPRAVQFIKNSMGKFEGYGFAANPSPIIENRVKSFVENYFSNDLTTIMNLMSNPTRDRNFLEWAKIHIYNFVDGMREKLDRDNYDNLMRRLLVNNRSRDFYDKYLADKYWAWVFFSHYPYFPNESDDVNEQYFISILNKRPNSTTFAQKIPAPLIIKKLEIMCGLSKPDIIDQNISEKLGKILLDIDPCYITQNPGAIHILKARPGLIDDQVVYYNPKVSELIECGLVKPKLSKLLKLGYNDPKLIDIVKNLVKEPIKDITMIEYGIMNNQNILLPSSNQKLIRRTMTHLFL